MLSRKKLNISLPSWRWRLQITAQFYGYYIVLCTASDILWYLLTPAFHMPSTYIALNLSFSCHFGKGTILGFLLYKALAAWVANTSAWFSQNLLKCNYCTPFIQNKEEAQGLSFTCFPPKLKFVRSQNWLRLERNLNDWMMPGCTLRLREDNLSITFNRSTVWVKSK